MALELVSARGRGDLLAAIFGALDDPWFHPHPLTREMADELGTYEGRDFYALLLEDGRPVGYGVLRGWDKGYAVPFLGLAIRPDVQGRGLGETLMRALHEEAARRGASSIRLRVHPENDRARRLYERLGYVDAGEERGERLMTIELMPTHSGARRADGTSY